jgi:hypothetical protein
MNPILSTFKTASRAVLVVALLGAGGLAAAPAMAQEPSFNFNLGIGPNGQPSFGFGVESGEDFGFRRPPPPRVNVCLSNNQVIRQLRDKGFSRVVITDSRRRSAEATARYGRWTYVLDVDKCSGEVDVVERFASRRRSDQDGFGLQFNFGS